MTTKTVLACAMTSLFLVGVGCTPTMTYVRDSPTGGGVVHAESGEVRGATPVPIVAAQAISSATGPKKQVVTSEEQSFRVASDVVSSSGQVLLAKGTPVSVRVTRQRHRRIGRPGTLEINPVSTVDTNGRRVSLTQTPVRYSGRDRMAGSIVGGVIILFPLLIQGGDVELPSGAGFTATTQ